MAVSKEEREKIVQRTRLTKKNQTTIPAEVRRIKGLGPGDTVEWTVNDQGQVFIRKVVDDSGVDRFVGIIETDETTEDIVNRLRGYRTNNDENSG